MCLKDSTFLQSLEYNLLVVDEAHRLKNQNSLLYKTISQVNKGLMIRQINYFIHTIMGFTVCAMRPGLICM